MLRSLNAPTYAVLANHDVEQSRGPFSRSAGFVDLSPARLLVDEAESVELRGRRLTGRGRRPTVVSSRSRSAGVKKSQTSMLA